MSNLKQRLQNALSNNLPHGATSFSSQRSTSPFRGRENMASPGRSQNLGNLGNSVLSERVSRISEKINEIHVNLNRINVTVKH